MNIEAVSTLLAKEEGEVLHAYQDHLGFWTIGVGHLIDKRKGGGISRRISRLILDEDIDESLEAARRYAWFDGLDDARQGVVLCMIFQLGIAGFAQFKRTHSAIAEGRYTEAASHMLVSKWAGQTPERAKRMAKIMRTGEWAP